MKSLRGSGVGCKGTVDRPNELFEAIFLFLFPQLLQQELVAKSHIVDALALKAANISDPVLRDHVDALVADAAALQEMARDRIAHEEAALRDQQQLQEARAELQQLLAKAGDRLQAARDPCGDRQAVGARLGRVRELQEGLPELEARMAALQEKAAAVLPGMSREGAAQLQEELSGCKEELQELGEACGKAADGLEQAVTNMNELEEEQVRFFLIHGL